MVAELLAVVLPACSTVLAVVAMVLRSRRAAAAQASTAEIEARLAECERQLKGLALSQMRRR